MTEITKSKIVFETDDHVWLGGTLYRPNAPSAIAVLSGATGVPERFYSKFARWLAEEQNVACLTFTYRSMEDTSPAAMKRSTATMKQWGLIDCQAARDFARTTFPDLPVWAIGHSLGGWFTALQPRLTGITRAITICTGIVHHQGHPMPYRLLVYLFWFVLGPLTTQLFGYLPGKSIGLGSTLPARVFWQWRKWCTTPGGIASDPKLPRADWGRSGAPVRIVATSDDAICPPEMAWGMASLYAGAAHIDRLELTPTSGKLGHMGLFREPGRKYWEQIVAPIGVQGALQT